MIARIKHAKRRSGFLAGHRIPSHIIIVTSFPIQEFAAPSDVLLRTESNQSSQRTGADARR